ncbi:MAG: metallophosphoesterase [Planctomycetes bacterium]|nr:metallophosphoesterase [Planctomycetota bacterium]
MGAKLLCVGDMHLGRTPSGLSEGVRSALDASLLTPARAWDAAVAAALELEVDAVLLAGDVVDDEEDFFEACGQLAAGVSRLARAGMRVIAVAGNHDVQVLPRLADALPEFHLLGRGGRWESVTIQGRDGGEARVLGWSFPSPEVIASPLPLPAALAGPPRAIGLVHCDRDQAASRYAPVRSADLLAAPVDAWLLGHVHKPDPLDGERPIGYLGSLSALDPSESGAHGPCLVEVLAARVLVTRLPLAPLRFEPVEVDAGGLSEAEELEARVIAAFDNLDREIAVAAHRPRAVGCRVRLAGRTHLRRDIGRWLAERDPRDLALPKEGIVYFIESVTNDARPAFDVAALAAGGGDPAALVARRLVVLERGQDDAERAALLRAARRRLDPVPQKAVYGALRPEPLNDEQLAALLRDAALKALDELLAQREGAP